MASAVGPGLWRVLWTSRLIVLLFAMFIYAFGLATLLPTLPTLLTNFFASKHAGHDIDCEQYDVQQQPAACQDAHADVVTWTSWTSLVANTFLSFLFAPIVGDMSDSYGRKPFILGGLALSTLPIAVVFAYLTGHVSLLWYYPCNALSSIISAIVVFLSYAADVLQPQHRTAGFGLIIAAYSTGFIFGPLLGGLLSPAAAALVAGGGSLIAIGIIVVAVPESRPPAVAAAVLPGYPPAAVVRRPRPLDACLSLRRSWALITSSSLFKRLALCMAIVGIVSEGIQDMLIQYLQLVVGFNTADQGLLFMVLGAANLLVQAALLPWLASTLGERRLLLVGLMFSILEQALLALSGAKWQAFAAVALGSLAGVSYPAISSIKSTHSRADQQGLVQGALAGIRALATGLGPLFFAWVFASCTKKTAVFGYHPGIVFWTTCGLTVIAAAVAASIPASLIRRPGHTSSSQAAGSSCSAAAGEETDALLAAEDMTVDSDDHVTGVGWIDTVRKAAGGTKGVKGAKDGRAAAVAAAPAGDTEQHSDVGSMPPVVVAIASEEGLVTGTSTAAVETLVSLPPQQQQFDVLNSRQGQGPSWLQHRDVGASGRDQLNHDGQQQQQQWQHPSSHIRPSSSSSLR